MSEDLLKIFEVIIEKNLSFLVEESYFRQVIPKEKICHLHKTFESDKVRIEIFMNKPEINFIIAPIQQPEFIKDYMPKEFDFFEIINYLCPNSYSGNMLDHEQPEDFPIALAEKFKEIGMLLKKHCQNILNGDFSIWPGLAEQRKRINKQFWERNS